MALIYISVLTALVLFSFVGCTPCWGRYTVWWYIELSPALIPDVLLFFKSSATHTRYVVLDLPSIDDVVIERLNLQRPLMMTYPTIPYGGKRRVATDMLSRCHLIEIKRLGELVHNLHFMKIANTFTQPFYSNRTANCIATIVRSVLDIGRTCHNLHFVMFVSTFIQFLNSNRSAYRKVYIVASKL